MLGISPGQFSGTAVQICPAFCSSSVTWVSFGTWPCRAFSKATCNDFIYPETSAVLSAG